MNIPQERYQPERIDGRLQPAAVDAVEGVTKKCRKAEFSIKSSSMGFIQFFSVWSTSSSTYLFHPLLLRRRRERIAVQAFQDRYGWKIA